MTEVRNDRSDPMATLALEGDQAAFAQVFERHRERLKKMIHLRLDRRLSSRLDASDVLQEAFVDMAQELPAYAQKQTIPLFLWMRLVTGQRIMRLHRKHLGAEMRDATRDISIDQLPGPKSASACIAMHLVSQTTSASSAMRRTELQQRMQQALEQLEPMDREIIALRSFEELSNKEAAAVLGIPPNTAAKRNVRALKRLQSLLGNDWL